MRRAYQRSQAQVNSFISVIPDIPSDTEVASGRKIEGNDTFFKLVTVDGNLSATNQAFAHDISDLDRVYRLWGNAKRDDADDQDIVLLNPDATTQRNIFLSVDTTNILVNIGTDWAGAGDILSDLKVFLEYTKT